MTVLVCSPFDDLRSKDIRLLHEASRHGPVTALVWSDRSAEAVLGQAPRFPEAERLYLVGSLRWVCEAHVVDVDPDGLPPQAWLSEGEAWACLASSDTPQRRRACAERGLLSLPIAAAQLNGFPMPSVECRSGEDRVIVTGCFDWLHSGHVRFFEEASAWGPLYVSVGADETVRELKGEGHPLLPEDERLFCVASVRFVHQAVLGSGKGWLDAAPEIERIRPRFYVVNTDGDRPEKRRFCRARGIEYVVLQRRPQAGLPPRSSTELRGLSKLSGEGRSQTR